MAAITYSAGPVVNGRATQNQRRNQRVVVPVLRLAIGGQVHVSADWSLGGFMIEPYAGPLLPLEEFTIEAMGPGDGEMMPLATKARVARVIGKRLAGKFVELDDKAFAFLEALMTRRRKYLEAMLAKTRAIA
jgi:hypothetical protein